MGGEIDHATGNTTQHWEGLQFGHSCSPRCDGPFDGFEFALCLTHDVDRINKTVQAPYYALLDANPGHLRSLVSDENPYWQFEELMAIEDRFDVRSSFYFLDEKRLFRDKSPTEWFSPRAWSTYVGYYDVTSTKVTDIIQTLDSDGWEVGLHGSYDSYDDRERLAFEKDRLEGVLGHSITGGRQHYLNLSLPESWRYHRSIGLRYDASLGSSTEFGFDLNTEWQLGTSIDPTGINRPFDDEFAVFPLTVMDQAVMKATSTIDAAWAELKGLLETARRRRAVMTVLWHPRLFNVDEFPGYRDLFERLLEAARAMNAWIGPVEDAYREILECQHEGIHG